MSDLRKSARQALEALIEVEYATTDKSEDMVSKSITTLRQALEQPAEEPVAWMYDWHADGEDVTDWVSRDYDEAHSPTMGCHNIRPLYIQPQPLAVERERNFCERCGKRLGGHDHIHTCTPPDDEQDELFCWKVRGTSGEYTGYYAEEEAKAVAKRIGGTCFAFPLYVRPQPAQEWQEIECPCCGDLARAFPPAPVREWVGLTDEELVSAYMNVGDKEWAIGGMRDATKFAHAIEAKLKEKMNNLN